MLALHLAGLRRIAIGPWQDPEPGERHLVPGSALFPWWRSRELSAAELRQLDGSKGIEKGTIVPPPWPLPDGFPDEKPRIRGLFAGGLVALLRDHRGRLIADPLLASPL